MTEIVQGRVVRFGVFEADLRTQELRKHGLRIRLPRQSFQVLEMLLDRPGDLVTREELQSALWPADTFVDFENGLNNAVKRIRAALGDAADSPRFVETLPRLGYRFIGSVEVKANGANGAASDLISQNLRGSEAGANGGESRSSFSHASVFNTASSEPAIAETGLRLSTPATRSLRWWHIATMAVSVLALGALAIVFWRAGRSSALPTLTIVPLTSYPGLEVGPTFSPDGTRVAFAWSRDDRDDQFDLYVKVIGTETPVQLTYTPALGLYPSWSPDGRFIAFARMTFQDERQEAGLYLIPAIGGPERKLMDLAVGHYVYQGAIAWSPDGKFLVSAGPSDSQSARAHVSLLDVATLEKRRLPDPSENCQFISFPAFSPDGRTLAVACQLTFGLSSIYLTPFPDGKARLLMTEQR